MCCCLWAMKTSAGDLAVRRTGEVGSRWIFHITHCCMNAVSLVAYCWLNHCLTAGSLNISLVAHSLPYWWLTHCLTGGSLTVLLVAHSDASLTTALPLLSFDQIVLGDCGVRRHRVCEMSCESIIELTPEKPCCLRGTEPRCSVLLLLPHHWYLHWYLYCC